MRDDWVSRKRHHLLTLPPMLLALAWFEVLGYTVLLEADLIPGKPEATVSYNSEVVLCDRLYLALKRTNPAIPTSAIAAAVNQLTMLPDGYLLQKNHLVHRWLTEGMPIETLVNGKTVTHRLRLLDRSYLLNNDWLVIQRTWKQATPLHCPDLIVLVNGLPLVVIQGIQATDVTTPLSDAYGQLQSYKRRLPTLLAYNAMLVITDGNQARVGTLTSRWQEFLPWLTIDGEVIPVTATTELEVLIQGLFDRRRFLELVQHFIWFETQGSALHKAIANYPFCPVPHRHIAIH